jgi:hypothetical protein
MVIITLKAKRTGQSRAVQLAQLQQTPALSEAECELLGLDPDPGISDGPYSAEEVSILQTYSETEVGSVSVFRERFPTVESRLAAVSQILLGEAYVTLLQVSGVSQSNQIDPP